MSLYIEYIQWYFTATSENVGLCWMDYDATHIVRVCFKWMSPFKSIVIVDSDLHIIWSCDNPVLSWNELCCSHRHVTHLHKQTRDFKICILKSFMRLTWQVKWVFFYNSRDTQYKKKFKSLHPKRKNVDCIIQTPKTLSRMRWMNTQCKKQFITVMIEQYFIIVDRH